MPSTSLHMPTVALEFFNAGRGAALATVVKTWGSAPRPVGSQLAIAADGTFFGSVSGGCVEGAVILAAQDAIKDGQCRTLDFGIADDDAFAVGLACGGEISVLIEPIGIGDGIDTVLLSKLGDAHAERRSVGCSVDLASWKREIVEIDPSLKSNMHDGVFTNVYVPNLRLMIVGAVHIAQSLCVMARLAGYQVHLIDPRLGFASKERFPDEAIITDWPDAALTQLDIDARSAIVTLSHDPKIDIPALQVALNSSAFYVGSLGSTRTHAKRRAALTDHGFTADQLDRIHGPVGLRIGAQSPAEIAISIMGELTQILRCENS